MIFIDRSRQAANFVCPRKRFLSYHFPDLSGRLTGLSPKGSPYFFATGTLLHESLQDLLLGVPLEDALTRMRERGKELFDNGVVFEETTPFMLARAEQLDLIEGMARAFARERLPVLQEDYTCLGVEVPINVPLTDDMVLMLRLDGILQRKVDGALFVWELKSTASASPRWLAEWEYNIQLMAETYGLASASQQLYGISPDRVRGIILEGVVKGTRKRDKDGIYRQGSPLIYGYKGAGSVTPRWRSGATKVPISSVEELGAPEERIKNWIARLPLEIVLEQLVALPVIPRSTEREQRYIRQSVAIEDGIREKLKGLLVYKEGSNEWWDELDWAWPQNTAACGSCDFKKVCHEPMTRLALRASGAFEERIPNHQLEKDSFATG